MSLVLSFGRPMVVRDIIRRSINSSQTLLLMKTLGNRITEPFHSLPLRSRSFSNTVFFRCYATETEEEKLQKKERRMEKIEQEKRQLINFGHKFNKMGGTKVVIAYFGLEAAFFLGIYGAFKAGLVTPDAIVALMNKYEITARFSHLIANNPNASLLTLAYATNKLTSPLRMALTAAYGTYIVDKNKKKNKINEGEMKACGKDGQCGCHGGEGKEGGCCHGGNGGCKGGEGGCCHGGEGGRMQMPWRGRRWL
ncbi:uncharacterized protein [Blastocystis hominis]|uniref:DUF1279 domain-containing protein n=1 Tax=Blastocystis hominis TaxID=12968 RepID=D8LXC5_BLAHO|nr:uncharacterized protein [Blastocystis hominis]CBK20920.2 unnamed protein product [Blastocystis hominis]|eukprot:XP_012894968.1 uncharacterized protein [Blastocystis hominis]